VAEIWFNCGTEEVIAMTPEAKAPEEQSPRRINQIPTPSPAALLLEQYKLLEERRKYFGSQFMQTIGGVGAILSVLVGLLGGKTENAALLNWVLRIGGVSFVLFAILGYRLGKRQDDCEHEMSKIEGNFRHLGYKHVATMPRGAKAFGARKALIIFLIMLGLGLIVIGSFGLRILGR
jgi:hypothetical protein